MTDDTQPRIRVITALLADDIRREISGKEILIGVFGASLILPVINSQTAIRLAMSVLFETPELGNVEARLELLDPSGVVAGAATIMLTVTEVTKPHQFVVSSLPQLNVLITTTGDIVVRIKQYEDDWEIIRVLPVIVDPTNPAFTQNAISPVPPSGPPQPVLPPSS